MKYFGNESYPASCKGAVFFMGLLDIPKNSLTVITHEFTPLLEDNAYRQVSTDDIARPRIPANIISTSDNGRGNVVLKTIPRVSKFEQRATLRERLGRYASSVTAVNPVSATDWQNDMFTEAERTGDAIPSVGPNYEVPRNEGADFDGTVMGLMGLDESVKRAAVRAMRAAPRAKRGRVLMSPPRTAGLLGVQPDSANLSDEIQDGESVDWRALTESGFPTSTPLSQAGTYHEGQVMDILDRLNVIREGWHKGMITDADYKQFAFPLATRAAEITGRIAGSGSKAAGVVNTIWGEIQNQGYIKAVGNQWVPQFPPAWPPKPVQIVFPKPNHKGFIQKITANPIKSVVTMNSKILLGGATLVTETGILGDKAKQLGKKAETVTAGVIGGGTTGFVASGFNPVGAVVGGAAGGTKGLVEATKTGKGSGDSVKALYQGAAYGTVAGGLTAGAAKIAAMAAAHPVIAGTTAASTAAPALFGRKKPTDATALIQDAAGNMIMVPVGPGQDDSGSPLFDTATGLIKDTVAGGVTDFKSDPLGFIKRKAKQVTNIQGDINAAKDLIGGGSQVVTNPDGSTSVIETPSMLTSTPVLLAGAGLLMFLMMKGKPRR